MRTSGILGFLLVFSSLSTSTTGADDEAPNVMTLDGEISGIREESTKGNIFYSYRSIPFAKPPLGELRFKDPESGNVWLGIKDGTKYPPACQQIDHFSQREGTLKVFGDEDCLYLNVYTSKPNEVLGRLPVMVFIHGGGFVFGSSAEYPPHALMNHDIVLVTIQYRLGILGFLSTEDEEAPGNLGLKDQTLALKWIQKNIHKFGGEPLEMTLFGNSAGAASVHYQILTPMSIGLFKRAILMSGSALCPWSTGGAFLEVAEVIGKHFNCSSEGGNKGLISCLQKIPMKDVTALQQQFIQWFLSPFIFAPRIDNDYIPKAPELLMKEKRHKRMDIMTGVTTHEGGLIVIPMYADERLRSSLLLNFPYIGPVTLEFSENDISPLNQTIRIFDYYTGGVDLEAKDADNLTRLYSDRYFNIGHDWTSIHHAENVRRYGKKVYRYEFTYRGQRSLNDMYDIEIGKDYVSHADDLFYFFNGGPLWTPLEREDDLKMRDIMTTLWTNFAIHGNPTPDDSLGFEWEPVPEEGLPHLNIKLEPTMEEDNRAEVRDFWASLPLEQNFILHKEKVSNVVITPHEENKESSPKKEIPPEDKKASSKEEIPQEEANKEKVEEQEATKTDDQETQIEEPTTTEGGKDEL
ncbi:Carboxylesterase 5A [Halocaridina rubra]|uniref:Carboxylic ester hydrolase n=1 Tax=Halocaridina rubra TaxID=373956 RepID=A0AAN9A0R9_HALRR